MSDFFLTERLMDQRVREEQHQVELSRLAREAQKAHPSWASRQRCRLLCQLGLALMSLGKRLLAANAIQAAPGVDQALAL